MKAKTTPATVNDVCREIYDFVNEGLQDVTDNQLLDFESTFDELERRYAMND